MCSGATEFSKMSRLMMLLLATSVVGLQGVFSASVSRAQEVAVEEGIRSNLIGYENELVESLTPPLLGAENHFRVQPEISITKTENPFVVEIHKNYLSMKTTGFPGQKIKLNATETEYIQKLSLTFVQLLNSSKLSSQAPEEVKKETPEWNELNPVIILTNSGISLQFLDTDKVDPNATEISPQDRRVLWDFLTKYARNIFDEKLRELKLSEKFAEVFDSPLDQAGSLDFQNFVEFLLNIMRLSVDYAETAFQGWTTSRPETTTPEVEKKYTSTQSTPLTLYAYEELSPFQEFPFQEFQYRKKDIDYILYGRGII